MRKALMQSLHHASYGALVLLAAAAVLSACGGGGDDDTNGGPPVVRDNVKISGTFSDTTPSRVARALPGVTVCTLGSCGTTDANGSFQFDVPTSSYSGGTLTFDFNSATIDSSAQVPGLSASSRAIDVDFQLQPDSSVRVLSVAQDGTVPTPSATPTPDDDVDDGPLSTDPRERACQILERTNISIPNAVATVTQRPTDPCPRSIDDLVVVGNKRPIGFDYEVFVDAPDAMTIEPSTARANQGTLTKHDATYLCTRETSFIVTVTARTLRYYPTDGSDPISTEEAVQLCGRGADVGNTSESVQVNVQIVQ